MREEVYKFPTEYSTKTSISHSSLDPHFTGRGSLLLCRKQRVILLVQRSEAAFPSSAQGRGGGSIRWD